MNDLSENRPSPDALLEQAQGEHRGKLKIFIGAAPGVGKTYSMLRAAQARRREGVDVVIGIVETHQRSETNAMLEGLESIPRLNINYRGIGFQEMDLDTILQRKPRLVLVDELAHSNITGARHPKRYQDVIELLDAGIDVYTTLNVQHIESLNDIVARVTGVTVRETVPDNIMQKADSIELVDLPPEELLQRLKEGKVYIPEQARLAMNRFFTPGNLTALRELALRQAAERVDQQMANYMRTHAIAGPWPTSDRVMVCIAGDGQASALVRTAKRSAERRQQSSWITLYVETHHHASLSEAAQRDIAQAMQLSESLGGECMTVASENIAGEILRIARERNVSVIIIGKSQRSLWSKLSRPSVASSVLEQGGSFDILVMSATDNVKQTRTAVDAQSPPPGSWFRRMNWAAYIEATMSVGFATGIAWGVSFVSDLPALSLIYLISILLIAVDRGFRVSAYASFLSFIAFDLFFTEPRYSLLIERHEDFLTLSFFLVVSLAIGLIGDRLQRQIRVTQRNAIRTQALYDFNKALAIVAGQDDVIQTVVRHISTSLDAKTVLLMPHNGRLEVQASMPADFHLDTASTAAMEWAWHHGKPAGSGSDTLPGAPFYGLPLRSGNETVGVLAIKPIEREGLTPEQHHFLTSLASQSAIAIERTKLVSDIAQARLQTETERLRASLLSSISHDLRTPLVAILGATTSLRDYWDKFDDKARRDLFSTIEDESERLNRFVQNLLDMTQLVSGGLAPKRQPTDVQDLIGSALTKLRKQLGKRPLRLTVPDDLPTIDGDMSILERVLVNVIENACKYAPADQPITISARREANYIRLTVADRGPGIPEEEYERVFDMFYRVKVGSSPTSGAGLGLAICRGFIEAHGGRIAAQTGADGVGTQIVIRLPLTK